MSYLTFGLGSGAIFASGTASVSLYNSSFLRNHGSVGGAVSVKDRVTLELNRCNFSQNAASLEGGALFVGPLSSVNITSCRFRYNRAVQEAGAISCSVADTEDALMEYAPGRLSDLPFGQNIATDVAIGVASIHDSHFEWNVAPRRAPVSSLRCLLALLRGNATHIHRNFAALSLPTAPFKPSNESGNVICGSNGGFTAETEDARMPCSCDYGKLTLATAGWRDFRLDYKTDVPVELLDEELLPRNAEPECSLSCPLGNAGRMAPRDMGKYGRPDCSAPSFRRDLQWTWRLSTFCFVKDGVRMRASVRGEKLVRKRRVASRASIRLRVRHLIPICKQRGTVPRRTPLGFRR